ncbi:hypothetical protein BDP55DRAFT_29481 [Colletotrichum godetiae]|uniref:Uncharacterized protein n=1 Tax=Colletotrichum godetiae TaxID=1209918 RepID=A0AAJ0AQZ5_9PEZI|nr:uncharacterized protein BDP55DRAFT_29481 [Colletotrichum godetiae]KAK1688758.1 hypothetical protein BDP55DRAFT_29481 [Colletotrichum godetiae]
MSSISQLKGPQRLSWTRRMAMPNKSQLRLRTRGLPSRAPSSSNNPSSLSQGTQTSSSRRSLLNLGVDTGRSPSGRRPCSALNPDLHRCPPPLILAAPAYTQPARLTSVPVPTFSSSSHHPKNFAFGHLRGQAASLVSWQSPRPFIARTPGSYDTISPNRSFATSAMVANKIDGTAVAKKIRESIASDILEKQKANPRFQPRLTIIQGMSPHFRNSSYVRSANNNLPQSVTDRTQVCRASPFTPP